MLCGGAERVNDGMRGEGDFVPRLSDNVCNM